MRSLLAVLVCLGCGDDDPGPLPTPPAPCTRYFDVDAGADGIELPIANVVAAADLQWDGTGYAAVVETWDGADWRIAVAYSDGRATLEWNPGSPAMTPPSARPRLGMSETGKLAVLWRSPAGDLELATATAQMPLGATGAIEPVCVWADAQTPAAVWLSPDRQAVVSSRGPVASWLPGWSDVVARSQSGGGIAIAAAASSRIAWFTQSADGAVTTVVDRSIGSFQDGSLHLVRDSAAAFYLGFVIRGDPHVQPYLFAASAGAIPSPIKVPSDEGIDAMVAGKDGDTFVLAPTGNGEHVLDLTALGTPPVPYVVLDEASGDQLAAPEPMVATDDNGTVAIAIVHGGRVEVRTFTASVDCR